jgi:SAM-dependent methyltransferase
MTQDETRQVAQYWDRIAPEFDAIYTGKKNPLARTLDRWLRRDMYERFDWVMRKAGDARNLTVCDVGCGSGRFVNALAQRGAQVTGLDFAPTMLELARKLVTESGVADRCDFVLSDVADWKIGEEFDLVIAIGFWDYVADPLGRLEVIRGITRGRFLSAWPRAGTWRTAIRKQRLKLAGCPVYFWTLSQVEEYLRRAGFVMSSSEIYGQLYCVEATVVEQE